MSARYRVVTPNGWLVPGMSSARESELWDRYCRIMGKPKAALVKQGYRVSLWDRGREVSPAPAPSPEVPHG